MGDGNTSKPRLTLKDVLFIFSNTLLSFFLYCLVFLGGGGGGLLKGGKCITHSLSPPTYAPQGTHSVNLPITNPLVQPGGPATPLDLTFRNLPNALTK